MSLLLRYNVRGLAVRSHEALMALGGMALASAVLVSVLALREGIASAFASAGSDSVAVLVRRGSTAEVHGGLDTDMARLAGTLDGVLGASRELVVLVGLERRKDGLASNALVRGMDPAGFALRPGFRLVAGRLPYPGSPEAIASRRLASRFRGLGLGETFGAGKLTLRTVGIFEVAGSGQSEVWGDLTAVQTAFRRAGSFSSVRVRLGSLPRLQAALAANPRLPLTARLERDYDALQAEEAAELPCTVGTVLAVLVAIGAGAGAMNTMFARVGARAREIGTLRAIGFGRGAIVASFVLEAALLGGAGGVLGVLLALPIEGVTGGTSSFSTLSEVAFSFHISWTSVLAATFVSSAVGVAGGLLPALHAARLAIPEAVRAS